MAKKQTISPEHDDSALMVQIRPLDTLAAYARNARTHDDAQVAQLMGSMIEWGFTNPILADADGIVAGHGRAMAARKLFEQGKQIKLPSGRLLPLGSVPVIDVSGWSEAKRRAYILADNQLATKAGWDYELLAVEMDELRDMDFNIDLIGFDQAELNELIGTPNTGPEPVEGEDDAPEPPVTPATVAGDVWLIGKHRLMCGDSTSITAVDKLMPENADMVFTDPPYLMDFTGGIHADGSKSFNAKHGGILNDKMSEKDGDEFLDAVNSIISAKVRGAFYITFYRLGIDRYYASMSRAGLKCRALIVWDKGNHTLSNSDYMSMYEPMFYGWVKDHTFYGGNNGMDIWRIDRTQRNDLHPTMKPVELVEKAILDGSKKSNVVLDLFGGSGTTLIACEKTGRHARLMELDPRYCDVIVNRWQEFTGQQATLEGDGRTFDEIANERLGEPAAA